jgi:hypothetical protein
VELEIETNESGQVIFLNHDCAFALDPESMLLTAPLIILFQQHRPNCDIDGYSPAPHTERAAAVAREATDVAPCDAGMPPRSWSFESVVAVAVMFGAHMIEQAKLLSRRDAMPIYISRGRFTSDAVKGMLANNKTTEPVSKAGYSREKQIFAGC